MKRSLVWLLVFIVLTLANSACAESFKLYNGVSFGMTMEQAAETVKKVNPNADIEEDDDKVYFEGNTDKTKYLKIRDYGLAGIGGKVYFDFSEKTGKLNLCMYYLEKCTSGEIDALINAYENKYGQSIAQNKKIIKISGEAHNAADQFEKGKNRMQGFFGNHSASVSGIYQWLVDCDDGSAVEIMLIVMNEPMLDNLATLDVVYKDNIVVTYSLRTEKEMQDFKERNEYQNNRMNGDI